MIRKTLWRMVTALIVLSIAIPFVQAAPSTQPPQPPDLPPDPIQRLVDATGGTARVSTSGATDMARFVRFEPASLPFDLFAPSDGAAGAQAMAFLEAYGDAFGVQDPQGELELTSVTTDFAGVRHVNYQQVYQGVPVFAGVLRVHFDQKGQFTAANGTFIPDVELNATPSLDTNAAAAIAVAEVTGERKLARQEVGRGAASTDITARNTTLYVFRTNLARDIPGVNHLVYEVEVGDGFGVREFVYVDAHSGKVVDQITGIYHEKNRITYNAQNDSAGANSVLCRGEGDPASGDQACDEAHDYAGDTYDYFWNGFGRDSLDDAGMSMISYVHVCPGGVCPWFNASWNGQFMSYGTNIHGRSITGDDTVAHEFGHGITDFTSNLIYQWQPGAINEAMSDFFGEVVDQLNGAGLDNGVIYSGTLVPDLSRADYPVNSTATYPNAPCIAPYDNWDDSYVLSYTQGVDWLQGEQDWLIRDMWAPSCMGDPDHVTHPNYWCAADDGGGVHTNSGVVNHHFALLTDGGTFNGQMITGTGIIKAGAIYYQAEVAYLVPASDFADLADALAQACTDLIGVDLNNPVDGTPSGEIITAADCAQVDAVSLAVELAVDPAAQCSFTPMLNPDTPPACPAGRNQVAIYDVDWESGMAGWTAGTRAVANYATFDTPDWAVVTDLPDSRAGSALFVEDNPLYGDCATDTEAGVLYVESPSITIPAGVGTPILTFDHWVATEFGWDGGNVKISVNGGPWTLLPSEAFFFNPYPTALFSSDNPLGGEDAFTGTDAGSVGGSWGQSRVSLSGYASAGDAVQVRFEMGLDGCNGVQGWYVDDVSMYECAITNPASLDGVVTDAMTGWPLYAQVTVAPEDGAPEVYYTDLTSGYYSVTVGLGVTHTVSVDAVVPGYTPASRDLNPTGDQTEDFALEADAVACEAPGYTSSVISLFADGFETFPGPWMTYTIGTTSTGWIQGYSGVPDSDLDPDPYSGSFYAWHNDQEGSGFDDWLVSPQVTLPANGGRIAFWEANFWMDYYGYHGVYVSIGSCDPNDGEFVELAEYDQSVGDWTERDINLPGATYGGQTVCLAFDYAGGYDAEWYVDDVAITEPPVCESPVGGGLVVGNVYDANTGDGINGADVSNEDGYSTMTAATADPDDGFYALFSPTGARIFTATMAFYAADAETVTVPLSDTVEQDFTLQAGLLSYTPSALEITLPCDVTSATLPLTLTNDGALSVMFSFGVPGTLLSEGFEGGVMPPSGWQTATFSASSWKWTLVDAVTYPDFVHSGDYAAWVNYDSVDSQDEWLFSPPIDLTDTASPQLTFWALSDTIYPGATMSLYAIEAGGAFTDTLWDMIADETWTTWEYRQVTQDLSAYSGETIRLAWRYHGLDGDSFGLDDIVVTAVSALPWLSVSPSDGTIPATADQVVDVTFDASELAAGQYTTQLEIGHDTPYEVPDLPVTLTVELVPTWDKMVYVNGELVEIFPAVTVPSDTVEIVDEVSVPCSEYVTFDLTEEWTESFELVDYNVYALPGGTVIVPGFGTAIPAPGMLVVSVTNSPGDWEYVITKTFTVLDVGSETDFVTETLEVEGAYPPLDPIILQFVSERNIYLPLVMRNY